MIFNSISIRMGNMCRQELSKKKKIVALADFLIR